jgi:putative SOS response-associated peptidase YedK
MCGGYASFLPAEALRALFQSVNPTPNWEPTWNMAPTRNAPVVRLHPQTRARHLDLLRWGLVPHWAKDPKSVRQPINARAETVATATMFRDALARRRCLVPADVFYEWQTTDQGKQPFAVAAWMATQWCSPVYGKAGAVTTARCCAVSRSLPPAPIRSCGRSMNGCR